MVEIKRLSGAILSSQFKKNELSEGWLEPLV